MLENVWRYLTLLSVIDTELNVSTAVYKLDPHLKDETNKLIMVGVKHWPSRGLKVEFPVHEGVDVLIVADVSKAWIPPRLLV